MTGHSILDPQIIALLVATVLCVIVLAVALVVLRAMWNGTIDLSHLLSESSSSSPGSATIAAPKASLSRFQFLIFTFVIAGLYLVLSIETGSLIEVPNGALVLLGISGATYAAGKAMSDKKGEAKEVSQTRTEDPLSGETKTTTTETSVTKK